MIKILKHGNEITYVGVCPQCQCCFECGERDLIHTPFCYAATVVPKTTYCPDCGAIVSLHGYTMVTRSPETVSNGGAEYTLVDLRGCKPQDFLERCVYEA